MYNFYLYHEDLGVKVRIEDPVGWDSMGKSIKRDEKLHGMFFEYTPKLQFIKKGKAIIHSFYEKYGIETELYLIVMVMDMKTRKFSRDYIGKFNLSSLEISTLYATCNVENTGFIQKFKNRMDVKVDLQSLVSQGGRAIEPFGIETIDQELHSKTIRMLCRFGFDEGENSVISEDTELGIETFHCPPFIQRINSLPGAFAPFSTAWETVIFSTEGDEYPEGVTHRRIYLRGTLTISTDFPAEGVRVTALYGDVGAGVWTNREIFLESGKSTYVVEINEFIDLEVNQELLLRVGADPATVEGDYPGLITFTYDLDSYFEMYEDTLSPSSNAPVMFVHEAFARICQSITDQNDSFKSAYYGRTDSKPRAYVSDGDGSLRGITDGKLLRGFPFANNPIHASFKDMLETFRAIDGIGAGIEREGNKELVVLEPISYFYKNERSIRLNWVADIKKQVDAKRYYNEILTGYKKWANEELNNLDEFNSKRELTLPITQVKNKLDLQIPYIASGYTLEYTRRDRYEEGSTKDNNNDNENFVIQLRRNGAGFSTDKDEDFEVLEGVLDPGTVYNAKLSISRNIIRNGPVIAASLYKTDEGIKMSFGEGNTDMVSKLISEETEINEGGMITKEQLGKAIWIPELYTFKKKLTLEQWQTLTANPTKYVEFSATDKDHKKGYLLEAVPDQKTREVEFTLLRANL